MKVNHAILIQVSLVDKVLELGLAGIETQRLHDLAELVGGDITCKFASAAIACPHQGQTVVKRH